MKIELFTTILQRSCILSFKRFSKKTHVLQQAVLVLTFSAPVVRTLKKHVCRLIFIRVVGPNFLLYLQLTLLADILKESYNHSIWHFFLVLYLPLFIIRNGHLEVFYRHVCASTSRSFMFIGNCGSEP